MFFKPSLVILTFAVLCHFVIGDDGNDIYTKQAREIYNKLTQYLRDLLEGLESYLQKITTENTASVALRKYTTAVKSATGIAKCPIKTPINQHDTEIKIDKIVDLCKNKVQVDESFLVEIDKAQKYVETLDTAMLVTDKMCEKKKDADFQKKCEATRKQGYKEIDEVLSRSAKAKYAADCKKSLSLTTSRVEACIDLGTESIKKALDLSTKAINECVNREKPQHWWKLW